MKNGSFLLSIAVLTCLALIATPHATSTSASWSPEPVVTSTPGAPAGTGTLIQQFSPDGVTQAPASRPASTTAAADRDRVAELLNLNKGALRTDLTVEETVTLQAEPLAAGGYAVQPNLAPRDLTSVAPGAVASPLATVQLLSNTGFETGSLTPWGSAGSGSIKPAIVTTSPHAGSYNVKMGGEVSSGPDYLDVDQLDQDIAIPDYLTAAEVMFYFRATTSETYTDADQLCAIFWETSGTVIAGVCLDPVDFDDEGWIVATWDLTADTLALIENKTVSFGFHLYNDYSLASTVYIDDVTVTVTDSPPSNVECIDLLANSRLDVTELGDGTGTIDSWYIFWQNVYYTTDDGYSTSTPYALVMVDEPLSSGADTDVVSSTLDIDEFSQPFNTPRNLVSLRVQYSRLYQNPSAADVAMSYLYTVDSEGYLDELVDAPRTIADDTGGTWASKYWELTDPTLLDKISGRTLALLVGLYSDRAGAVETIFLDDVQVTACYERAPGTVYVPVLTRAYASSTAPICIDTEPDSVTARGYTELSAVCNGSFSQVDQRDYYTLDLVSGVTKVRLSLYDLPTGTEWDALLYEDAAGYPFVCQIGIPGSADKYKDCTVNAAKNYFVIVNAGAAPDANKNTYHLSVTPR